MKHYFAAVTAIVVLLCNVGFVAEASVKTVEYDAENEMLTVQGIADSEMQAICMEVLAGGVTVEQFDLADAEEQFNMLVYADETLSVEGGIWQFHFEFPGDSEKHIIRVREGLKGAIETRSIVAMTPEEFNDALEKINSATAPNISAVLKECAGILGLDSDTLETLPQKNCDAMALRILEKRNKQPNQIFANCDLFEAVFNEELAVECVNAADGSNLESVLEKYEAYFDYKNEKAYQLFEALSAEQRKNVYENLSKADYSSPAEVDDAFILETVRVKLAALRGYDELYDVLPQCADALDANISKYTALSKENQLKVCSEIITNLSGKSITKEALEQIVNSAAEKYGSGGSGGSGTTGGGGGGASSGGTTKTPSVDFTTSNEPSKDTSIFNDLGSVSWARESIEELAKRGIINGKGEKTFAPNDFVTREEFVKMAALAMGLPAETAGCSFNDVEAGAWYYDYISRAVSSGIVNGMGDGSFGVGMNISRQDMAQILWNCIKDNVQVKTARAFEDEAEISDYAKTAVNAMRSLGIIDGYEDNTFRPNNTATRAEAAKLLYEIMTARQEGSL